MFVNSKKIAKIIEGIAPIQTAESWDNVGFQIGNKHLEIDRVMVALEVTQSVVAEAINKNIDLIVTHHPLIFSKLKKLTSDDPVQSMVMELIKNNINLYVAHTNLDASKKGTNYYLSNLLGLKRIEALDEKKLDAYYKLGVFVPEDSAEKLREVLFNYGAGVLGNYDHASFNTKGIGTFRPLEGSNPSIGEKNQESQVNEVKIEVVIKGNDLDTVVEKMLNAHPYETVAYDVIKLENLEDNYSIGLTGYLDQGMTLDDLAEDVKEKFGIDQLKVVRSHDKTIRKVALCSGAGSDYITLASRMGCKCLITGDIKYHEAQLAKQLDLNLIDAGHFETENIYTTYLKEFLSNRCKEKGYDIKIIESESIENPFEYQ